MNNVLDNIPSRVPRPGDSQKPEESGIHEISALKGEEEMELTEADIEEVSSEITDADIIEEPNEVLKKMESQEAPVGFAFESTKADKYDVREDQPYLDSERSIIAAKDGLGGIAGGDVASKAAASLLIPSVMEDRMAEASPEDLKRWINVKKLLDSKGKLEMSDQEAEQAMRDFMFLQDQEVAKAVKNDKNIKVKAQERADKDLAKVLAGLAGDPAGLRRFAVNLGITDPNIPDADIPQEMERVVREKYADSVGTTSSIVKLWENADGQKKVTIGNVGDSRVYCFADGELEQLTKDDSYVSALNEIGLKVNDQNQDSLVYIKQVGDKIAEFKKTNPNPTEDQAYYLKIAEFFVDKYGVKDSVRIGDIRNQMLMNIGGSKAAKSAFGLDFHAFTKTIDARQGATYLTFSDGITDNLPDATLKAILKTYGEDVKVAVSKIREAADIVAKSRKHPDVKALEAAKGSEDEITAKMAKIIEAGLKKILPNEKILPNSPLALAKISKDDDMTAVAMQA